MTLKQLDAGIKSLATLRIKIEDASEKVASLVFDFSEGALVLLEEIRDQLDTPPAPPAPRNRGRE
mgnify:CR=1 FL=1